METHSHTPLQGLVLHFSKWVCSSFHTCESQRKPSYLFSNTTTTLLRVFPPPAAQLGPAQPVVMCCIAVTWWLQAGSPLIWSGWPAGYRGERFGWQSQMVGRDRDLESCTTLPACLAGWLERLIHHSCVCRCTCVDLAVSQQLCFIIYYKIIGRQVTAAQSKWQEQEIETVS